MSDTSTTSSSAKRPSLFAYQVRDIGDGKSYWNRIGAAWDTKSGGFIIQLDCLPLDGRIVCQPAIHEQADGGAA
ncbi:hypothetical protein FF011L_01460 [Roseimaritima multifibrata]|uniref:Uncharacterized protein n=1 Tax=Roseimaritima multifibrata TaxID=1930274 RepID=A0A517M950_9BACT|nr:hypothetical protein [Roseimaritima multifibrata]QDS91416.1 hypothetical protein FF011L_01460 [Roseimaritima multifibrata]